MTVKLPRYTVLIAAAAAPDEIEEATEHEVTILHGDQLRAELEAPRQGIPAMDTAPMHGITLWIWAALMRTHVIDQPYQDFVPRLLGFEETETGDTLPGDVAGPADPTLPVAPSGSPSPWPSTGPEPSIDGWQDTSQTQTG